MHEPFSIEPSQVYDDGALSAAMGLSSATLAAARRSGRLRFTRQGKRILYLGRWLLDWLEADSEPQVTGKPVSHAK